MNSLHKRTIKKHVEKVIKTTRESEILSQRNINVRTFIKDSICGYTIETLINGNCGEVLKKIKSTEIPDSCNESEIRWNLEEEIENLGAFDLIWNVR